MSEQAQAAKIPLIKSPSLRVPPPVQLPPDVHPLPDDVSAYFVYPFTLEPHVITLESSRQSTLAAHATRRDAYLRSRQEEKERRKREALRKIAPGFEPTGGPLVPVKVERPLSISGPVSGLSAMKEGNHQYSTQGNGAPNNVMDDLVEQLEAMEARTIAAESTVFGASSNNRTQFQEQYAASTGNSRSHPPAGAGYPPPAAVHVSSFPSPSPPVVIGSGRSVPPYTSSYQ